MSWVAACCVIPDWAVEPLEASEERDEDGVRLRCDWLWLWLWADEAK